MRATESKHRRALEEIANHPSDYNFKGIIAFAIEPTLLDPNSHRVIAAPDIVFYDTYHDITLVEYKSNGNDHQIKIAKKQLENAADWFNKYAKISPRIRVIHGSQYPKLMKILGYSPC